MFITAVYRKHIRQSHYINMCDSSSSCSIWYNCSNVILTALKRNTISSIYQSPLMDFACQQQIKTCPQIMTFQARMEHLWISTQFRDICVMVRMIIFCIHLYCHSLLCKYLIVQSVGTNGTR